jgi:hypothetical protein
VEKNKATVTVNGQSADLDDLEATMEVLEPAVRDAYEEHGAPVPPSPTRLRHARQSTMLARHPQMDEHAEIIKETVRSLADQFPKGSEVSLGVKIPYDVYTEDDQHLDVKLTIKLDAKPHQEKD